MRNYVSKSRVGQLVGLVGQIRDVDGVLLSNLTDATVTVWRDFADFAEIANAAVIVLHSPPLGTTTHPDPRWSPGMDGSDGFNVQINISFDEVGRYKVLLEKGTSMALWWVHVGSGAAA